MAPQDDGVVGAWIAAGRPLISARRLCGDPPDGLRLGLALPGKRRASVVVAPGAVERVAPPLGLAEVTIVAPSFLRAFLARLGEVLMAEGVEAHVFGSLAWHCLSGGALGDYLTATSDVDLLFAPMTAADCERICRLLAAFCAAHPEPRLDGEIILPGGGAVAWRELAARPERVLLKASDDARLVPLAEISACFEGTAA